MSNEEQQSVKLIDFFLENTVSMEKLTRAECKDVLSLASATAASTQDMVIKGKCYDLLYECCFHMDLDIKEMWNIYWILKYDLFRSPGITFSGYLDRLYRAVFLKIKAALPDCYAPYETAPNNLVVITTDQMIGIGHAPTRRVLDYAYAIFTGAGKAVMIVNGAGMNYYRCHCLTDPSIFNFDEELNKYKQINYKGVNFLFKQIDAKMPDLYCIRETLDEIYELKPELVYNIGGSELVADLCGAFTKTCCFPCSTDIPITMSRYLLVGRQLDDADSERLSRLEDYQQTVETVVNYQMPSPAENSYSRSDFGLSDSDFVFGIVGNRLDTEMNDSFIELMDRLLLDMDMHFLIIGEIRKPERILEMVSFAEKVHFSGRILNAELAIKLLDVYLNPYRIGGGRSSFEALAQGVPVITFRYGDVYHTCGDEFAVEDDEHLLRTAEWYMTDSSFMERQKSLALKRADRLSDIASTQKEVLDKILND